MNSNEQTVYVELLNEGTQVWRPVQAIVVRNGLYQLLRPEDYDENLEEWQFLPGTVVHCETRDNDLYAIEADAQETE